VTHADASGQMRIYTPSVISALQRHLGSTHPELGAPLENLVLSHSNIIHYRYLFYTSIRCSAHMFHASFLQDVPPGRVSSHWESRVLQGSIMAAVLGDWTTVRIDPVTLAALQDTGWYAVDLSRAQNLVWGDGEERWR